MIYLLSANIGSPSNFFLLLQTPFLTLWGSDVVLRYILPYFLTWLLFFALEDCSFLVLRDFSIQIDLVPFDYLDQFWIDFIIR